MRTELDVAHIALRAGPNDREGSINSSLLCGLLLGRVKSPCMESLRNEHQSLQLMVALIHLSLPIRFWSIVLCSVHYCARCS